MNEINEPENPNHCLEEPVTQSSTVQSSLGKYRIVQYSIV